MKIVYFSSVCEQDLFDRELKAGRIDTGYQNQKFHSLLLEGLKKAGACSITVISFPPVNRKERFVAAGSSIVDGVKYVYPAFIRVPLLKQLSLFFSSFFSAVREAGEDCIMVCNVMDDVLCCAALAAKKYRHCKSAGVVTDIPTFTSGANEAPRGLKGLGFRMLQKLSFRNTRRHDGYMLLTREMNHLVNPSGKPWLVIEGFSDSSAAIIPNGLAEKNDRRTVMYAGSIHRQYGIGNLVSAFNGIGDHGWDLVIYGAGNYHDELERISSENPHIIFKGLAPNSIVVAEEARASLLVNPRPTSDEYVKYSFPSKTLEFMASGTPLLTTDLPGMPDEYRSHVYLIKDETADGIKDSLIEVMGKSDEELHAFGMNARTFILENKNNIKRGEEFMAFLQAI